MKNTKKIFALAFAALLSLSVLASCTPKDSSTATGESKAAALTKLTVGASPTPHSEILEVIKDDLAAEGFELVIKEFTDYVLPNTALEDGSLDANYFQHLPYLESFNTENGTSIVSAGAIHYEPFGLYAGKTKSLDELKALKGAKIAVPNDTTNEARALLLLQDLGIIKLADNADLTVTKNDIKENPNNVEIVELDAAQVARSLPDVDAGVINGNFALEAGLNASKDALSLEAADSLAATTFGNIIAVRKGDESNAKTVALLKVLRSDKVKKYITDKYAGAVVAIF
ncbi:MAG: MetQ/NlpA family ABC transporter substrate-binding protein [Oscillospiraceae bacterium]|jgi:D-methionine transport system substrate-binding protein|nr:MetQ/NlpA family ABC transporter substrate-binding protein [Oscillospiraceae bacterium]